MESISHEKASNEANLSGGIVADFPFLLNYDNRKFLDQFKALDDDTAGSCRSLKPEQNLVCNIFIRALRDATGENSPPDDKEQAIEWLRSDSCVECSALWWAEMGDQEELLRVCRELLNEPRIKTLYRW